MSVDFSSLNPYESLVALTADNPEELVEMLKSIRTPIKIVQIVHGNNRATAYIMGHINKPNKRTK